MRIYLITTGVVVGLCLLGLSGCGSKPAVEEVSDHSGEEHAHDVEGPHGGHIIELGTEDLHAELTHDEATHKVGIYLLGSDAKTAAASPIEVVRVNVAEDGQPTQYELPAVAQAGDGEGKSSYFEIISEPLCKVVCGESEAKSTQARVSFTIGEQSYAGMIETSPHDHDHGHEH